MDCSAQQFPAHGLNTKRITFEGTNKQFLEFRFAVVDYFKEKSHSVFISHPFVHLLDQVLENFLFFLSKHTADTESEDDFRKSKTIVLLFDDLQCQIVKHFLGLQIVLLALLPEVVELSFKGIGTLFT
jgi:hypothetical protein